MTSIIFPLRCLWRFRRNNTDKHKIIININNKSNHNKHKDVEPIFKSEADKNFYIITLGSRKGNYNQQKKKKTVWQIYVPKMITPIYPIACILTMLHWCSFINGWGLFPIPLNIDLHRTNTEHRGRRDTV